MKRPILFFGILFFLMGGLLLYFAKPNKSNLPESKSKQLIKTTNPYEEYMIDRLRKRNYDGGKINVINKAYATATFSAFIVSYKSDRLSLRALMSIPKGKLPQNGFPVLIFNHGYIDPEKYSTISSYKKTFDFYASQGYIVLKPDYRGHGESQGDPKNQLNRLAYAIDVLNLLPSISTIQNANPNRIYMWGHSLGGDVTLRVLEVTDKIKAASLWAPVSADYPESMLHYVRKNHPQQLASVESFMKNLLSQKDYDRLSPSKQTQYIKTPIIIHQGTSDESVPLVWNQTLAKRLLNNKINFSFYEYKGEDHNFNQGSRPTVFKRDLEFFGNF